VNTINEYENSWTVPDFSCAWKKDGEKHFIDLFSFRYFCFVLRVWESKVLVAR